MSTEEKQTCLHCKFFQVKEHPEQAARGLGHCLGFLPSAMDFMGWDDKTCRSFRDASDIDAREQWAEKFKKQQEKK